MTKEMVLAIISDPLICRQMHFAGFTLLVYTKSKYMYCRF